WSDEGYEPLFELLGGGVVFGLLAVFWLAMALVPAGRTVGDRWSGTRVIDADSDESLRVEAPPRYVRSGGAGAAPAA
ncbi:MAG TPA: hypothetical protein VK876_12030, partial [Rubrivivax sp.]|nr:hypothetical protein [Rubrivivax sp.]